MSFFEPNWPHMLWIITVLQLLSHVLGKFLADNYLVKKYLPYGIYTAQSWVFIFNHSWAMGKVKVFWEIKLKYYKCIFLLFIYFLAWTADIYFSQFWRLRSVRSRLGSWWGLLSLLADGHTVSSHGRENLQLYL